MNDMQEIHGAPLSGPRDRQSGLPRAASHVTAGAILSGRWLLKEMRGWHDRQLAAHEISRALHQSLHGGRVRHQ